MDVTNIDLSNFLEKEEQVEYHKKLAQEAEAFLQSCGKSALEVFRMEKFVPTPQEDESTYGKFHEGDSYVVLKQNDEDYQIHYWHGKDATSDEMGCSAFFSVQLSERLPKKSSHHLEEQTFESDLFMSYFKNGVQYLPGGIESGMKQVVKDYTPKLFQVKGARHPRVYSVPVAASSINEGDVFILDCPNEDENTDDILFYWTGNDCNMREKGKGLTLTDSIKFDEKKGKAEIRFPRENEEHDAQFWAILGGKPAQINPAVPDDATQEDISDLTCNLYHISNDSGKLMCNQVTETPLKKEHLLTGDAYILELHNQIYIWIGKQADVQEKKQALVIGQGFLKEKNKPPGTRVTRIVEGAEDTHFRSFFDGFYGKKKADVKVQDMDKLAAEKREVVAKLLTNLGNYTVKVYLCVDNDPKANEIPAEEHGHFYQGNVYVIDVQGQNHRYCIQWFGPRTNQEQVAVYRNYVDILTDYTHSSSEISRVTCQQGHEDDTLLTFFPNGFICHDGPRLGPISQRLVALSASGCLFRVMGPYGEQPQAIQQNLVQASNLNSGESFVLIGAGGANVWSWHGSASTDAEKAYADKLCGILSKTAHVVAQEHSEPDDFWAALGGKTEYLDYKEIGMDPDFEARLFDMRFSDQGKFWMNEIHNFSQMDLHMQGAFILDAYKTIYIWMGNDVPQIKKKNTPKKVEAYVANLKDRSPDSVQIVNISPCDEPLLFTRFFPEWEIEVAQSWLEEDPYTKRMREKAEASNALQKSLSQKLAAPEESKLDSGTVFDISILKSSRPEGVPAAEKEKFLSDAQFQEAFKMSKQEFSQLKTWKQQKLKKEVGLF